MKVVVVLVLLARVQAQVITFGSGEARECETVGGPGRGEECQFPFIFSGVSRSGCITDSDPEGRPWCSTRQGSI